MTPIQHDFPSSAWNLPELLLRVENDQELLRDLLTIFEDDFPPLLRSLQAAVAASDAKKTAAVSHTLRGMLSNLAATGAAAAAGELEKLANAGDQPALHDALIRLHRETTAVGLEIHAYLNGVRA